MTQRAIHFICGRSYGLGLSNLTFDKATKKHRSGQWDISTDDAQALIGGWVYLHPTKAGASEFGGLVEGFEPVLDTSLAHSNRVVLIVQSRLEGKGQRWRGQEHTMAHSGRVVDATYPHERSGS